MARISIYVSDELKARMDEARDALNWSDIARPAFEAALATLNHRKGQNMQTAIERLRASKAQYAQRAEEHGKKAGRDWASDKASFYDLRAISKINMDHFDLIDGSAGAVQSAIVRAVDPDDTYGSHASEIIFDEREWPATEWLLAWIAGAQEFFEEIEDQL